MDAPVTFSGEQRRLVRQLARRRMFLFFFGLIGVSAIIPPYPANPRAMAANLLVLGSSVVAIGVIAVGWQRRSLPELNLQHNIVLALVFLMAASLAVHFAFPVFVFVVLLLLNRFL